MAFNREFYICVHFTRTSALWGGCRVFHVVLHLETEKPCFQLGISYFYGLACQRCVEMKVMECHPLPTSPVIFPEEAGIILVLVGLRPARPLKAVFYGIVFRVFSVLNHRIAQFKFVVIRGGVRAEHAGVSVGLAFYFPNRAFQVIANMVDIRAATAVIP